MPHNKRFPQIWQILTRHLKLKDKILLDIGCGYGDLILAAYEQSAIVYGVDSDDFILKQLAKEHRDKLSTGRFFLVQDDINGWTDEFHNTFIPFAKKGSPKVDILTCFSVLPYLVSPTNTLRYFKQIADTVVIECQYYEDGPGFEWLQDDDDMLLWLEDVWSNVRLIGKTLVKDRHKFRSIWLCES